MNDYAVLAVIYATVFVANPLIAVLHELGHALAYLLLTKPDHVDVYIGSYGDDRKNIRFRAGKLRFFIKWSFPFIKGVGLCKSAKAETDWVNYSIILLGGVVFTLLSAAVFAFVAFYTQASLLIQISCYIFLALSALSLVGNMIPRAISTSYIGGLDNDGKQLLLTLKLKHTRKEYLTGIQLLTDGEFDQAAEQFKLVLQLVPNDHKILRFLIMASLQAKHFRTVNDI